MLMTSQLARTLTAALLLGFVCSSPAPVHAEKQLTIAAPGYEKTITLDEDPELIISYTPNGMKIDFANLNMKVVCIEDPSTDGLCRLQAYDASVAVGGGGASVPPSPAKPAATAGNGEVTLTWAAPADNGSPIVGYKIEQTSPSTTTIQSNTGSTATSYTVQGLTNGTAYKFSVAAINGVGLGYMSPSSDAVTPEVPDDGGGDDGGGPSDMSKACDNLPANVTCLVIGGGNLESGAYQQISIDSGKTLTLPFDLGSSSTTSGGFRFNSFYNVNGTFANSYFETWLSASPAGATDLTGATPGSAVTLCYVGSQYAEFTFNWSRGATPGASGCYLGTTTDTGIVYLNMRFRDFATGALRAYGATSFFVE